MEQEEEAVEEGYLDHCFLALATKGGRRECVVSVVVIWVVYGGFVGLDCGWFGSRIGRGGLAGLEARETGCCMLDMCFPAFDSGISYQCCVHGMFIAISLH